MTGRRRASAIGVRRAVVVPLAIAVAAVLAACGGAAHSATAAKKATPAQLVSQAVGASSTIDSGRIDVSVDLALNGIKQLDGTPIALDLSGPFTRGADGRLSTDLRLAISAATTHADVGLDVVDGAVYVELGGTFYRLGSSSSTLGASGASGASGATGASGPGGLFARLGIDPRSWLIDPHIVGTVDVGGVPTEHLTAQVNIANVLDDVTKLLPGRAAAASGATGASSPVISGLMLLESAITSAQVDVYTGVADHIVRRVALSIDFTVPAIAAGAIDGLTGGSLDFEATLTDLNQTETITAPANPQPESKIENGLLALESEFGSLAGLSHSFGGLLGGTGSSASGTPVASSGAQ